MAQERRPINGIVGGGDWTATLADVDELVADADGNLMSAAAESDQVQVNFNIQTVVDADTVTNVEFVLRAKEASGSAGSNFIDLTFQATTVRSGGLTTSFQDFSIAHANWDTDWTVAELESDIIIDAIQVGMPETATWEIDCIDMIVDYTPAGGGDFKSRFALMGVG